MFYTHELLRKRDGKFALLWLAATNVKKLNRRELSSVNLSRTCDDILDLILRRFHPNREGRKPQRLSLYLSSQLVYGLVKIYNRQSDFLLTDASSILSTVKVTFATVDADIDLNCLYSSNMVTMPDVAVSDGQQLMDPYFGDIKAREDVANVDISYAEQEMWKMEPTLSDGTMSSPASSRSSRRSNRSSKPRSGIGSPHTTVSSADEITIKEVDDTKILGLEHQFPLVEELSALDGKEIQTIFEEPVGNIDWVKVLSPRPPGENQPPPSPKIGEATHEKEITDIPVINLEQLDMMSPKEKTPFFRRSIEVPERRPLLLSPGVTPIPTIQPQEPIQERNLRPRPSLTLMLPPAPVTPSPLRRRRQARRLIVDRETQISKASMKDNLETSDSTCTPFVLPATHNSTVQDLLDNPCSKGLKHPDLIHLFQRNRKYGILESASDLALPVWSVPELGADERETRNGRKRRLVTAEENLTPDRINDLEQQLHQEATAQQDQVDIEIPVVEIQTEILVAEVQKETEQASIEIARDTSNMSLERSRRKSANDSTLNLQTSLFSDAERSERSVRDSETDGSTSSKKRRGRKTRSITSEEDMPQPVLADISAPAPMFQETFQNLSVVVEEKELEITKEPESYSRPEPSESSYKTQYQLLRSVTAHTMNEDGTYFSNICPPSTSTRKNAAKNFAALLDLCKDQKLSVQQDEPFGEIYIQVK